MFFVLSNNFYNLKFLETVQSFSFTRIENSINIVPNPMHSKKKIWSFPTYAIMLEYGAQSTNKNNYFTLSQINSPKCCCAQKFFKDLELNRNTKKYCVYNGTCIKCNSFLSLIWFALSNSSMLLKPLQ